MQAIDESIERNKAEIVDLNISQHRDKGVNSAGKLISNYAPYTPLTVNLKGIAGTLTSNNPDVVNLHDEGDFHAKMDLKKTGQNKHEIYSNDSKSDELETKYNAGDISIFGLIDENMQYVGKELVLPNIIEKIKREIFTIR